MTQLNDALRAAIEAGHVKVLTAKVTAKHPDPGKPALEKEYDKYTAVDVEGMLVLCEGKQEDVISTFNYAFDLNERASVRNKLLATVVDPMVAITKAAKLMFSLGLAPSEEAAIEMVKAQYDAKQAAEADNA